MMGGLIMPEPEKPVAMPTENCGNCKWGRKNDQIVGPNAQIECNGVPPTPTVVGVDPRGNPQIALLRPVQPASTRMCGLWAPTRTILSS